MKPTIPLTTPPTFHFPSPRPHITLPRACAAPSPTFCLLRPTPPPSLSHTTSPTNPSLASNLVARLTDTGTPNPTFGSGGGGGITTYDLAYDDFALGSALFYDSNLIIAGAASDGDFDTHTLSFKLGGQQATTSTYSTQWRLLNETNQNGTGTGGSNYIWSQLYTDGLERVMHFIPDLPIRGIWHGSLTQVT